MEEYLNAGLDMDLEKMEAIYDPNFENIRIDRSGRTINIKLLQLCLGIGFITF